MAENRSDKDIPSMLPCPFCGGEAEVISNYFNSARKKQYNQYHPTCKGEVRENCPGIVEEDGEQGGSACDCYSVEEAVKLWNKRV